MAIIKQKEQRVGVFIDAQNVYHSAKNLYRSSVNFKNVLEKSVSGRQLIRAVAYVIKTEAGDEDNFFEALVEMGIETKQKDLQIFHTGAKKGDWDVGLTIDAVTMAQKLDVVVIVSGDGDFIPLVDYLKFAGCQVELISFKQSSSSKLLDVVDDFVDMSEDKESFLMGWANKQKYLQAKKEGKKKPVKKTPIKKELKKAKVKDEKSNHKVEKLSGKNLQKEKTQKKVNGMTKEEAREVEEFLKKTSKKKKTIQKDISKHHKNAKTQNFTKSKKRTLEYGSVVREEDLKLKENTHEVEKENKKSQNNIKKAPSVKKTSKKTTEEKDIKKPQKKNSENKNIEKKKTVPQKGTLKKNTPKKQEKALHKKKVVKKVLVGKNKIEKDQKKSVERRLNNNLGSKNKEIKSSKKNQKNINSEIKKEKKIKKVVLKKPKITGKKKQKQK